MVYDPSIGKKISVTIVATGFEINNLPQIDMDDENDGPIPLEPGAIWDEEPEDTMESEITQTDDLHKQIYIRPEGKPALILQPGDDINELDRVPAYVRRNKKLSGIIS